MSKKIGGSYFFFEDTYVSCCRMSQWNTRDRSEDNYRQMVCLSTVSSKVPRKAIMLYHIIMTTRGPIQQGQLWEGKCSSHKKRLISPLNVSLKTAGWTLNLNRLNGPPNPSNRESVVKDCWSIVCLKTGKHYNYNNFYHETSKISSNRKSYQWESMRNDFPDMMQN